MPLLRLAVLDVDGTLKEAESPYQFVHRRLGLVERAAVHRQKALAGEISYGEWLSSDVRLWAGQSAEALRSMLAENPYLPGAVDLLRSLKAAGVVVALVSAGFTLNTDPIAAEFGIDHVLANELGCEGGVLDGTAVNHCPEGGKAAFACGLMERLGISPAETLAAGDTHGDLELFACAGVRIAVNPRSPALRARADAVFEPDLTGAIDWLIGQGYLPTSAKR